MFLSNQEDDYDWDDPSGYVVRERWQRSTKVLGDCHRPMKDPCQEQTTSGVFLYTRVKRIADAIIDRKFSASSKSI